MKRSLPIALLALLTLLAALAWWRQGTDSRPPVEPTGDRTAPAKPESRPSIPADDTDPIRAEVGAETRTSILPTTPPATATTTQEFFCVDEQRRPLAGAEVRLAPMPATTAAMTATARSDDDGIATFAALTPGDYAVQASGGHQHHVPDLEHPTLRLPSHRIELELRELWIGGLEMPGTEVITYGGRWTGFTFTPNRTAETALAAEWQAKHPDARFWVAVRNPARMPNDIIDVDITWFGHARHQQRLRLWPASRFEGPEIVDAAAVPRVEWARIEVVLTDADGEALPAALQKVLRGRTDLQLATAAKNSPRDIYTFRDGSARLPIGDYRLRLFDPQHSCMTPVAECAVDTGTRVLRVAIPSPDRIVHLSLRDLDSGAYMLQIVHESGRSMREFGRADGEHTLLLPPGPCTVNLNRTAADGRPTFDEHVLVVTEDVEQEHTWRVPAAR
ncbi:MAG: carboxypeptidase regulatory-like domain-containing protein [Planctomycetes bacterium]|nr:carboxypeptidase regulatory-like domain-containing protein [Planctomycetota bacterium]